MHTVVDNITLVDRWLEGGTVFTRNFFHNMFFENKIIYSTKKQLPIARVFKRTDLGRCVLLVTETSATTPGEKRTVSQQRNLIAYRGKIKGIKNIFRVLHIGGVCNKINHEENIVDYHQRAEKVWERMDNTSDPAFKSAQLWEVNELVNEKIAYEKFFKLEEKEIQR
jgi:hypothetical protein